MTTLGEWEVDEDTGEVLGEAPDPDQDVDEPELFYGSVAEFVEGMVIPVFRRATGERAEYRWCARWWESAEAVMRLEALWRSWEHLRLDPATGLSVWLRDHADHHLAVLMSPSGPWSTSTDSSRGTEPLPHQEPPEGLFPDVRDGNTPTDQSTS